MGRMIPGATGCGLALGVALAALGCAKPLATLDMFEPAAVPPALQRAETESAPAPDGLRLLGPRDVRLLARERRASPQRGEAVPVRRARHAGGARARRRRLLRWASSQRDLRRGRALHPRPAARRRRHDLGPGRVVVPEPLGRRSPLLAGARFLARAARPCPL